MNELTDKQKNAILGSARWMKDDNFGNTVLVFTVPFDVRYEGASNSLNHDSKNLEQIQFGFKSKTPEEIQQDLKFEE